MSDKLLISKIYKELSEWNLKRTVFWLNREKKYQMITDENNGMGIRLEVAGFLPLEVLKSLEALLVPF